MNHNDWLFFKSYKWGYTKDAFASATRNKPGIRVSIDIKDMWIDNIFDFNKMSKNSYPQK